MINKRQLIKNLLSHNDENTFFDKKETIDIKTKEGKAKLLKHITALSNSNPENNSFLIIGVDDKESLIKGTDLIDDSHIQNLVASSLIHAPIVKYENIHFPDLPINKVIGLLTISPLKERTAFSKSISKIKLDAAFYRRGSNSIEIDSGFYIDGNNKKLVNEIENYSKISLQQLLDDTFDFFNTWDKAYNPKYLVFKDQFVLCWSGYESEYNGENCLSEVDIRILNESTRYFYSATQWVKINITENQFSIDEFVILGFDNNYRLYPLERKTINFQENGKYTVKNEITFEKPTFPKEEISNLYKKAKSLAKNLARGKSPQTNEELDDFEGLANYFLICYFNGIEESKVDFLESKKVLDGAAAEWYTECTRILNKYETKNGS